MVESRNVKSVHPLATRASWFTRVACAMAVCLVCQLLGQQSVFGVIVNTVTGTGNTTAPSDNPGWGNVGVRGIGTGVYLGNLWVLTASHVGGGDILLQQGVQAAFEEAGRSDPRLLAVGAEVGAYVPARHRANCEVASSRTPSVRSFQMAAPSSSCRSRRTLQRRPEYISVRF